VHQRVCRRNVIQRGFDVLHCLAVMTDALRGSLVLMQECDASDQREVHQMIAALRKAASLSQYELAEMIGEPQPNIAYWELSDKRRALMCCRSWPTPWASAFRGC
jgi:hypothetical protein